MSIVCTAHAAEPTKHYTLDSTETAVTESGTVEHKSGIIDNAAYFSDNAYASLPSGIMSDMTDFTISAWVKPNNVSTWARVFDFGTGTSKYMFLTLTNGSNTVFAITNNGAGSEQKITAPVTFENGVWTHIAVTKSGNTGIIYVNGIESGRNESMTLSPSSLGTTNKNYIAKSQYSADPYFSGGIDDFRIYDSALSAAEVAEIAKTTDSTITTLVDTEIETQLNTPPKLPTTVHALLSDGSKRNVSVVWEEYDSELLKKDGSFTIEGSVEGTELKAKAVVRVKSQSLVEGVTITTQIQIDGGKATAEYDIINESDIDEAIIYMAIYNEGVLEAVKTETINLNTGKYTLSADLPDMENIMTKAFIWDKKMKPLAQAVVNKDQKPSGSSFEVSEVKLTDGIFKTSQDVGKAYIMSFDTDKLLAPVAHSTGASTDTSNYYGGWEAYKYRSYTGKGISGHTLGHWMSAMATMYASTGDEDVKTKLDTVIDKLAQYQAIDGTGYIGGVEKTDLVNALKSGNISASGFELNGYWVPWYSFHKIYQGLVDAYQLAGNEKALEVVCAFADWAIDVTKDLSDDKFNDMLNCEYGGMNEVMAELYNITGEKKYYDLAIRFSQPSIITPLSNGIDELQGKHANTQIPKIIGAAAIYDEDTECTHYRDAAEFFYDTVVNHRSYVIGGNSNREHFGGLTEEVLGPETLETCNTYNMMKLTEHLYSWSHSAEYMDYYERALFNHILASQDPESGEKTYFMATTPGHFKVYSDGENGHSFWCCMGSGMENPGRYTRDIYYKDGDKFYVNQFISSTVDWKEKNMKLSQTTNYPYEDTTVIRVENGSGYAQMKIRIPSWIDSPATIKINEEAPITVSKSGYYAIDREWSEGDRVTVTLPMGLHTYTARDDEHKVAFMYGPVVLAGALGTDSFPTTDRVDDHTVYDNHTAIKVNDIIVNDKAPDTFIEAKDLSKLEFEMTSLDGTVTKLMPYADLHHQRYSLYWMLYGKDENIEKDEFTQKLDAVTIDTVYPNEQQPEVDHAMMKNNSFSGYFSDVSRGWRDARGADGYFSYEMKVNSDADKNYVMALYWGSDGPFSVDGVSYTREFDILVDDTVVGSETLNKKSAGNLVYAYYEIPSELIAGKDKVTVKFRPKGANKAAGGVFEVRTTTDKITK